ncbi:MAG: competence/damage-inducible protein A [Ignavibacteriales bacterium]|nr:competence/damage-inducible protein A [Ignavibacteriales bacterium]
MTCEIITIGDELLIGQVINTNQAFIAEQLNTVGVFTDRMTTVGDDAEQIKKSFVDAYALHDVVCVTGGLGPTHDDITKKIVAEFFQTDLIMNEQVLSDIKALAQKRNISLIQSNIDQALVPRTCTVIPNTNGTAPGMMFENDAKYFFVMPGVPFEMKAMIEEWIIPFFKNKSDGLIVRHRTLKTTGIGESMLAHEIGDIDSITGTDGKATLAFLPNPIGTKLRITVKDYNAENVERKISAIEKVLRTKAEKYIYSSDEKELEDVIGILLREKRLTVATAESCTGGLIANRITNVPGSSDYFLRGFITYSNQSKVDELGIPMQLIVQQGAVSKEVAEAMARGARGVSKTDIAISCTGIAGPTGGSLEKPVGLCYIRWNYFEENY